MRTENEKLDIEREAAQRLLSEMEDAGAQKAAELAALAQENESLSKERADMERLVSTAQQQAEATGLELSRTVEENSKLRESAESMQMELHRLKTEKLAQQVRVAVCSWPRKHRLAQPGLAVVPIPCYLYSTQSAGPTDALTFVAPFVRMHLNQYQCCPFAMQTM